MDLEAAIPLLQKDLRQDPSGKRAALPSGDSVPVEAVTLALALDALGLCQGQMGNWKAALDSHSRAIGTMATAGAYEAELPTSTAYSGLRGGAGEIYDILHSISNA